ncbi:protein-disulfide reductase DsbD family protein [Stigmatella aurantiaca]|uniref:Thiol:disulfide interchange protein DsbD n=1 Tax=Stigmatella aurantiaca (strain DW4/3-1) TaxID=378806 RepID=Q08S43_STIAD|nr:thioredoxin family protein [Stigmatella aurantiaca]ADO76016.1 Thioredoxin-like protein [Stigmatella aurantiaca DW4/3-1]EAU63299.1 thiol:disulfide interchange protein DsbD [Stigmatella aurantiaca DW4/3-1]
MTRQWRAMWAGVLLWACGAVAWAEVPASAVRSGALDEGEPRLEAALLVDATQVKPGDPFRVGVRFRMDPDWHIYWKNPGDSGLSTEVSWDTPGTTVGALRWPFPSTFRTPDGFITTHGYQKEVVLFAEAQASAQVQGALTLSAAVDALVCAERCIPAEMVLSRSVPVGPETLRDAAATASFDVFQAQVPLEGESAGHTASLTLDAPALQAGQPFTGTLTVAARDGQPPPGVEADFFVPERLAGIARVALTQEAPGRFRLEGKAEPGAAAGQAPRLKGVLRLGTAQAGFRPMELDLAMAPLEAAPPGAVAAAPAPSFAGPGPGGAALPPVAAPAESSLSLGLALLFAFLGGAILNLMPCVFPVLALKAYGFTRLVQEDRRHVGAHALAYTGGIVGTMGVLAAVVLAVRAGGAQVGWGFQFQEPLFVAAVSAVVVAFALNLFGVYQLGADGTALAGKVDASRGLARSAGEGMLAVVLATPCSAPLLGTAVGFAFAAGPLTVVATFVALGLGLALPFCALVMVPGLARRLPKPGAWMEVGKQFLGFALLGTTVWLLWVMGGLAGVDGMARLLAFLVAVALGAWLYGQSQSTEGTWRWVGRGVALVVLLGIGGVALRFEEASGRRASSVTEAQPWEETAVAAALKAGQPVFIDFTADWCLTCKFNERTVLAREDVRAAFAQHQVAFFVADWTRRDARISARLAAHGRAGVPMYLVISPSAPDRPEVLPELLTQELVIQAVERAAGRRTDAT